MKPIKFELNKVVSQEAKALIAAREKAFIIHHSTDIDAAGDEIEIMVRNLIKGKLPTRYYVGHGHIVDVKVNHNGQHDLIIADNIGSPVLFKAENGTEFFPYESVYAVGEIKSTYVRSKNQVATFVQRMTRMYSDLHREETDHSYMTPKIKVPELFTSTDKRPHKSPLFKFMLFVDGGKFELSDLKQLYEDTDDKLLPNMIILLNEGVVVKCKVFNNDTTFNDKTLDVSSHPEFIIPEESSLYRWSLLKPGDEQSIPACCLAYLYFMLNSHLKTCMLLEPNLGDYFANIGLFGRVTRSSI